MAGTGFSDNIHGHILENPLTFNIFSAYSDYFTSSGKHKDNCFEPSHLRDVKNFSEYNNLCYWENQREIKKTL